MSVGVVAQLGFGSGWMLFWSAAAVVPLLLHFLNRRRQQSVPWAAMKLLLQVIEKESKRIRIEQLILLAVRVLILIVLAFALARPFLGKNSGDGLQPSDRQPKFWLVAIDTSYSMGYQENGMTRMERAKKSAVDALEQSQAGDAFALVTLGNQPRAVTSEPTFDKARLLSELQQVTELDTGCNMTTGLILVQDFIKTNVANEQTPNSIHILLISDLGFDSWQPVVIRSASESSPSSLSPRGTLSELQANYQVDIIPIESRRLGNTAVLEIKPSTNVAITGQPLTIAAVIESYGSSVSQIPVQFAVDGQTIASQVVDLKADEPQTVRFKMTLASAGQSVLSVALPKDALPVDNVREHVIKVRDDYRILFVENQTGDSRLLQLALKPTQGSVTKNVTATINRLDLPTEQLAKWNVIVLNDVESITEASYRALLQFVRSGGSLIALFGPHTSSANWNELQQTTSLLGFDFKQPSAVGDWTVDPLEYQSPVAAPFALYPDAGLLTTPVFRYWEIERRPALETQVDLAIANSQPLILRNRIGTGWVASVLSAPVDGLNSTQNSEDWNAIATWPSFLPIIQQLVTIVLDTSVGRFNLTTGEPLQGVIKKAVERAEIVVTRPTGNDSRIATEQITSAGVLPWFYDQTATRGVYRVRLPDETEQPYAVNINPVESSLATISIDQLPKPPANLPDGNGGSIQSDSSLPLLGHGTSASHNRSDHIAKLLLGLLATLLLCESTLGCWLGRRIG